MTANLLRLLDLLQRSTTVEETSDDARYIAAECELIVGELTAEEQDILNYAYAFATVTTYRVPQD